MTEISKTERVQLHAPHLEELRGGESSDHTHRQRPGVRTGCSLTGGHVFPAGYSSAGRTGGELCRSAGECCGVSRSHQRAIPLPCQR